MPTPHSNAERTATGGHPIAVVAARTGLSRDVLRVWERRYAAVEPTRSSGGQRLYSDEHIRRFRLLAAATRHGRSIGMVAALSDDELERLAAEDEALLARSGTQQDSILGTVEVALASLTALDGQSLDAQLRRACAREGVPWFLEQLIPAMMRAVGDGWAAGRISIAQEHLASYVVLGIVLELVRNVPAAVAAPRILVATPAGDRHAVGAAIAAAAASLDGWAVVYLGADVPAADIAAAAATRHVRAIALSIVFSENGHRASDEVRNLRDQMDGAVPLFIGGGAASSIASTLRDNRITLCDGIAALRVALARVA